MCKQCTLAKASLMQMPNWPFLIIGWVAFIKVSSFIPLPITWITALATVPLVFRFYFLCLFRYAINMTETRELVWMWSPRSLISLTFTHNVKEVWSLIKRNVWSYGHSNKVEAVFLVRFETSYIWARKELQNDSPLYFMPRWKRAHS